MHGVLAAETAVFHELNTIRIVLLVLESVVIPLLAFSTCQTNLNPHICILPVGSCTLKEAPKKGDLDYINIRQKSCQSIFSVLSGFSALFLPFCLPEPVRIHGLFTFIMQ